MYDNTAGLKFDRLFPEGNGSSARHLQSRWKTLCLLRRCRHRLGRHGGWQRAHSRQRWSRRRRDLQLPVRVHRQQPAHLLPQFSPDGKHFAYRYSAGNQAFVFVDGVKGMLGYLHLDGIGVMVKNDNIAFSPDSSKVVYMGFNNNDYLVYSGRRIRCCSAIYRRRFFRGRRPFSRHGSGIVTLDGKILKLPNVTRNASQATNLGFSPDGSHYAFVVRNAGVYTLYVDGVPQSAYYWAGAGGSANKAANCLRLQSRRQAHRLLLPVLQSRRR
jgi:hypothetical protein